MASAKSRSSGTRKKGGKSSGGLFALSALPGRRLVRLILLSGVGLAVLFALIGTAVFLYYINDPALPTLDKVADYRPKVTTRVLSRDGRLIGEIFDERRTVIGAARLPEVVKNAFIDAEDAQFRQHPGLNAWGMLRAFLHNLRPGAHLHGASTITQQLVRTYILRSDKRTLRRKIQEMYLSVRLEQRLSKDEILWLYLNQIYFGHGRYGIEEAARFYFGKSVSEVTIGEAALLASLPKGPEEISPRRRPERAKDRQRYVLSQMVRYHHISEADGKRFSDAPIQLAKEPNPDAGIAPEFLDEAEHYLEKKYGTAEVPYLGLNVRTTCDVEVQRAARQALEHGLRELDRRNGYRGGLHLSKDEAESLRGMAKEYPQGPPVGKIVLGTVASVHGSDREAEGAKITIGGGTGWLPLPQKGDRYNPDEGRGVQAGKKDGWPRKAQERFKPGDIVRVRISHTGADGPVLALENGPQGAAVVIEPETRQVLALVGGYGYGRGQFNRATKAKRQPGSSFKPFLYAAAFDSRQYTPATVLNDSPQIYAVADMAAWTPKNAETHGFVGEIRLRQALAKSLNSVASQLIFKDFRDQDRERAGDRMVDRVIRLARAAGIESQMEANPSLALGTSLVTPLELTNAYATFAAAGRRAAPQTLLQVGDEKLPVPELTPAMSPEVAYVLSAVLRSVIEEGTGVYAKDKLRQPAAGKTGTTNDQRDAWFVGYTPALAAGVWVGYDDMRKLGEKEQGARAALPVWVELMQTALQKAPAAPFRQPTGVVVVQIDPQSGKLAAPGGPSMEEVFLEGTQPTEQALAPGEHDPNTFNQEP